MNLNLTMDDEQDLRPRITVFGVGGAGGNAVNNMIEKQLDGVEFVVANTDAQALGQSLATSRIQLGPKVTEGLGAGAKPAPGFHCFPNTPAGGAGAAAGRKGVSDRPARVRGR